MGNCPNQSMPPKCVMLDVLRNPYFASGYASVRKGKNLNSHFSDECRKLWFYERGRIVAGEALEKFGRVPKLLLCRHIDIRADGFVINPIVVDLAWPMLAELTNPHTTPDYAQQKFDLQVRGARA